jgi:hypothetical protein
MLWVGLVIVVAFGFGFWVGWSLSADIERREIETMLDYVDRGMIHSATALDCVKTRLGKRVQGMISHMERAMTESTQLRRELEEMDVEMARSYISEARQALLSRKSQLRSALSDFKGTAGATKEFSQELIGQLNGIYRDLGALEGEVGSPHRVRDIRRRVKLLISQAEVVLRSAENLGKDIGIISSLTNATNDVIVDNLDEAHRLLGGD